MTTHHDGYRVDGPARLPLQYGGIVHRFALLHFTFSVGRWVAVWLGDIADGTVVPLRIESACVFGHIFNSRQCDCGFQLEESGRRIADRGRGLILYALDQDARGLGTAAHFEIYRMRQQEQMDTESVFAHLGSAWDTRDYAPVVVMLSHLGVRDVLLLSNNSGRVRFLHDHGFTVNRESLVAPMDVNNMSTLMLELEDLGYEMEFKTHADWLTPLQEAVDGHADQTAAALVLDNERQLWSHIGDMWCLSSVLSAPTVDDAPRGVLYLTDLPRHDELEAYAAWGVPVIVVAHAFIPYETRTFAEMVGVRLVDWERKNRWRHPRPQWHFIGEVDADAAYTRGSAARLVSGEPARWREVILPDRLAGSSVLAYLGGRHA